MTAPGRDRHRGVGQRVRPANLIERRMTKFMHSPPSVRLAAQVIVTATVLIVVVGGVVMRFLDHSEYASIWIGMWWVLQTVTTVGYGDYTPKNAIGRILTSLVMLYGIAFLSITTAAITSVFVARAEQERATGLDVAAGEAKASAEDRFDRIDAQLARLTEQIERLNEHRRDDPPS
jgi:voltage-gated potassium channel